MGDDSVRVTGYRVTGLVQGVGFRWWTRRQAEALGLRGDVRNLPDGTVEIRAAGPPGALATLRDRLGDGAPGAHVREVLEFSPPGGELPDDGFHIVH